MNFPIKLKNSMKLEYQKCLLKYDLSSSVEEILPRIERKNAFTRIFGRLIGWDYIYKLRDTINLECVNELKIRRADEYGPKYANYFFNPYLQRFILEYKERLLNKYQDNPNLFIERYLSVHEVEEESSLSAFKYALNFLFEAQVQDRCLWKRLFRYVTKTKGVIERALQNLDPDRLRYFLRHICNGYEDNEEVWKKMSILYDFVVYSRMDQLKVILEYKSNLDYDSEGRFNRVELNHFLSCSVYHPVSDILPKNCSLQRLNLLVLMAESIWRSGVKNEQGKIIMPEKAVDTIKLCWKTIPHAYITVKEMENTLGGIMATFPHKIPFKRDLKSICESYKETFDDPPHHPRSLKNFARMAIRKLYSTADAVDGLPIPKYLKLYIKLQL